ncbi:MAG TPA: class I SAM-dependent methyltransferase, partial [Planctomycetota bacterium]|nr:class I SAM-dependent methyltransferase [Planctomycetota bacterium]
MIEQAQQLMRRFNNVEPHVGDGRTLAPLPDQYFDLVVSFHVFQHIPSKAVIADYVREMFRVLRQGGLARLLVKTKRWQHQGEQHDTWHGVELDLDDVAAWRRADPWLLLSAADFVDPTLAWVLLQKP